MSEYQSVFDRLSPKGKKALRALCIVFIVVSLIQLLSLAVWGMDVVNRVYILASVVMTGVLFIGAALDIFFKYTSEGAENIGGESTKD